MTNGQPVEVALDLYPGQIFPGKVQSIWKASGEGQYLPSGNLPVFHPEPPKIPQGCFAVAIVFDDPDQSKFPIGAQGVAAVYTKRHERPVGRAAPDFDPDHLVDELALSHAVLMVSRIEKVMKRRNPRIHPSPGPDGPSFSPREREGYEEIGCSGGL